MTFNTGNPIGSTDARDLSDNAENFDKALGTTAATWVDRFGVTRDSFEGRLAKGSFYRVGTFTTGYTLTNMRQTLEYNGHEYSWAGTFPKVVTPGSTPTPIEPGSWVERTDDSLRDEVRETVFQNMKKAYAEAGYNLVSGSFQDGGILSGWPDVLWDQVTGRGYQWHIDEPKNILSGSFPTDIGTDWIDKSTESVREYFQQIVDSLATNKADKSGSVSNTFDVAPATDDTHAIQKQQAEALVNNLAGVVGNEFDALNVDNINRTLPTKMLTSSFNFLAMLIDGCLYTGSGANSIYATYIGRGSNAYRTTGIENMSKLYVPTDYPIVDFGGSKANHWCLDSAGNLFTWGPNAYGQCGLGHTSAVASPTLCMTGVAEVFDDQTGGGFEVSRSAMWVRKTDNTIWCWGENEDGELGIGNTTNQSTPVQNTFCGTDTVFIYNFGGNAGWTVIQKSDNKMYFVGYNTPKQSGLANASYTSFTEISILWASTTNGKIEKICSGGVWNDIKGAIATAQNMLVLFENGYVYSCGGNAQGSLGTGDLTERTTPVRILSSVTNIVNIFNRGASPNTMSALTADGKYYVWGFNAFGALGIGTTTDQPTPTLLFSDVDKVFLERMGCNGYGYRVAHFITRVINGKKVLYSCGYNALEACGIGGFLGGNVTTFTKVLIPNDEEVVMMSSTTTGDSAFVIIAITASGKIYAWGCNDQYGLHYPDSGRISYPQQYTRPDVR